MITGFGRAIFISGNYQEAGRWKSFKITEEAETKTVDGFPFVPGPLGVVDSAKSRSAWKIALSTGSFDDSALAFIFDKKPEVVASISLLESISVTVPATTPFAVTVADLDEATVVATILSSDGNVPLTKGAVSETGFTANTNVLTFDESYAGATVAVSYMKTYTNRKILGGPTAAETFGKMAFSGVIVGTRFSGLEGKKIYIPEVTRANGVELELADETTAELEYNLSNPPAWPTPWTIDMGAAAA